MADGWPRITYKQANAAFQAGQKLHLGGRIFLVRPALRTGTADSGAEAQPVLWVTDQRTLGNHGLLLFPDGRIEGK